MSSRKARVTILAVMVLGLTLLAFALGVLHGIAAAIGEDFADEEEPEG